MSDDSFFYLHVEKYLNRIPGIHICTIFSDSKMCLMMYMCSVAIIVLTNFDCITIISRKSVRCPSSVKCRVLSVSTITTRDN